MITTEDESAHVDMPALLADIVAASKAATAAPDGDGGDV